jgi:hypothetical protein
LPYIKPTESDEVRLPSDATYFVRLKRRATYGDQLAAQSAMVKVDSANPVATNMEWGAYIRALTVALILEWNVDDENGVVLPISAESLSRLSAEDGQFLSTEATNRAKTRAVEQERPFALPLSNP